MYARDSEMKKLKNLYNFEHHEQSMQYFCVSLAITSQFIKHIYDFIAMIYIVEKLLPSTFRENGIFNFFSVSSWYDTWHSYRPESSMFGLTI